MNKEKQIDEMAKLICTYPQCIHYNIIGECKISECQTVDIAEALYNAGYRKTSEVAEEIFAEIEKEIESAVESNYRAKKEHYNHSVIPNYDNFNAMCDGKIYAMRGLLDFIAELKKKYTQEK